MGIGAGIVTSAAFPFDSLGDFENVLGSEDERKFVRVNGINIPIKIYEKSREIGKVNELACKFTVNDKRVFQDNGSGFILGDKYITAHHVYDEACRHSDIKNLFLEGIELENLVGSARHDISVFKIPDELSELRNKYEIPEMPYLREGQTALIYSPFNHKAFRLQRIRNVNGLRPMSEFEDVIEGYVNFEGSVFFGDSGSPVLDYTTGDVLGIVTHGFGMNVQHRSSSIGGFSPIWKVNKLLRGEL